MSLVRYSTRVLLFALALHVCLSAADKEKPAAARQPLLAGADVSEQILSLVQRACQDCHSPNTRWPWYSRLPAFSQWVHGDVARARKFMDLTKWSEYTEAAKRGFLVSIATALQSNKMPPRKYIWAHRKAKLSNDERGLLRSWALEQHRKMRQAGESESARDAAMPPSVCEDPVPRSVQ